MLSILQGRPSSTDDRKERYPKDLARQKDPTESGIGYMVLILRKQVQIYKRRVVSTTEDKVFRQRSKLEVRRVVLRERVHFARFFTVRFFCVCVDSFRRSVFVDVICEGSELETWQTSLPRKREVLTSNLALVRRGLPHEKCSCLAVERIVGVRVPQQLGKEDLENVDHVCGFWVLHTQVTGRAVRPHQNPPNIGLQVWLMTSKHTEPLLYPENTVSFISFGVPRGLSQHAQFVNVGVVDFVHETNGRRFVRVLIRKLDVDLKETDE